MAKKYYTKEELKQASKNLTLPAKILKYSGAARFFKDGDGVSFVFRWYHPLSWLLMIIFFPICAFTEDAKIQDTIPFVLNDYWQRHRSNIQWL